MGNLLILRLLRAPVRTSRCGSNTPATTPVPVTASVPTCWPAHVLLLLLCCCCACRSISLIPFLQLQARLEGLPVEQLDMHMARQLAEELSQPYQAVSVTMAPAS